jgi:hypothetical protein
MAGLLLIKERDIFQLRQCLEENKGEGTITSYQTERLWLRYILAMWTTTKPILLITNYPLIIIARSAFFDHFTYLAYLR